MQRFQRFQSGDRFTDAAAGTTLNLGGATMFAPSVPTNPGAGGQNVFSSSSGIGAAAAQVNFLMLKQAPTLATSPFAAPQGPLPLPNMGTQSSLGSLPGGPKAPPAILTGGAAGGVTPKLPTTIYPRAL